MYEYTQEPSNVSYAENLSPYEYSQERPEVDIEGYEIKPTVFTPPEDLGPGEIAYNPSGMQNVSFETNGSMVSHQVVYLRVEPNVSNSSESHLGKTVSRPYVIENGTLVSLEEKVPCLYGSYDLLGEDPSFKKIRVGTRGGTTEQFVASVVNVTPKPDIPNEVEGLRTVFYTGDTLDQLAPIARGPEGMKDIRVCLASPANPKSTGLHVYGRPHTANGGNITYTYCESITDMNSARVQRELIENIVNPDLYEPGAWGGVNDAYTYDDTHVLLIAHNAQRTGKNGVGRRYEPVLYVHDLRAGTFTDIGSIGSPEAFERAYGPMAAKDDSSVDLSRVVFTGGFTGDPEISATECRLRYFAGYKDRYTSYIETTLRGDQHALLLHALGNDKPAASLAA